MTAKRVWGWWVFVVGVAAVMLHGFAPEAVAQEDTLAKTYTTLSGIAFKYPEGWIVTETVDGDYTLIELANTPSADEKDFESAMEPGEAKLWFYLAPASQMFADMGLPADAHPFQVLNVFTVLDPLEFSFGSNYEVTIGGASWGRIDGSANDQRFDFAVLAGQLADGTALIVQANTTYGEIGASESIILAICDSIMGSADSVPAESAPDDAAVEEWTAGTASVPANNAVAWQTGTVSLSADNFYIVAGGKIFTAAVDDVDVAGDPGDEGYTTLEIEWEEHGVPMRLYMYFESDGANWQSFEIRTYDGSQAGEWITYESTSFTTPLGKPYQVMSFAREHNKDGLFFENLHLQAFTSGEDGADTTIDGPTTDAVTTIFPTTIAGPEDCHNVAVSIRGFSSEYGDLYTPENLLDGDPETGWSSAGRRNAEYIVINLGGMQTVYGILFNSYSPSSGFETDSIKDFAIRTTFGSGEQKLVFEGQAAFQQGYQSYTFDPVETDYLNFNFFSTHGGNYFEAADIMVCASEAAPQTAPVSGQRISQWASRAAASSQYSDAGWSAAQATGAPDTPRCGDYETAWASSTSNGIDELTVFFDTPVVPPARISIYQTYNPGAVSSIALLLPDGGGGLVVPNSTDLDTPCPGVFSVDIPDGFTQGKPIEGVMILVDQSDHTGWNEIDAVALVGFVP